MKPHIPTDMQVIRCMDGDTFLGRIGDDEFHIRLVGIDAPERGQPHYRSAKIYLESLIMGKQVNARAVAKDRYGRFVCWVHVDGEIDVSAAMLSRGIAWYYCPKQMVRHYKDIEVTAREERVGIWAFSNPVAPWDWRKIELDKIYRSKMTPLSMGDSRD